MNHLTGCLFSLQMHESNVFQTLHKLSLLSDTHATYILKLKL